MSYPTISNMYNQRVGSYVVGKYEEKVKEKENYEELFLEAQEFNQNLIANKFVNGSIFDEQYQNALNILDGMMGYLVIDKLKIRLPIYHGTTEDVLQKAIGHLEGSHLPTGDLGNSTVLTGHTGLPSADLLTDLVDMEVGDTFKINVLDKVFLYEIFEINVVEPHEIEYLDPISIIDMVTLVTCTPYGINSHRLLVHGMQIPFIEEEEDESTPEDYNDIVNDEVKIPEIIIIATQIIFCVLITFVILSKFVFVYYIFSPNKVNYTIIKLEFKRKIIILYSKKKIRK